MEQAKVGEIEKVRVRADAKDGNRERGRSKVSVIRLGKGKKSTRSKKQDRINKILGNGKQKPQNTDNQEQK
jgi:hypothetical protein